MCSLQLPHGEHVLKSFEAPGFINQFSAPERKRVASSCLSASGFGILDRKLSVLAAAERIMGASLADSLLSAKLRLRRLVLCYLYPTQFKDVGEFVNEKRLLAELNGSQNSGAYSQSISRMKTCEPRSSWHASYEGVMDNEEWQGIQCG